MSGNTVKLAEAPWFERGLWNRSWFMAALCVAFVEFDWGMVPLAVFPFVFIFPVMLVAWNRSLFFALACAVALSGTRVLHQSVYSRTPLAVDELANALICFFVLALLALLTNLLARQARQLRRRVSQLEGILPICASCKSIRDEHGQWVQLEGYISTHTPAQFSHSFCPECFKAFYGEVPASEADKK
jgi:K+-sensing histidine kinase KdpD